MICRAALLPTNLTNLTNLRRRSLVQTPFHMQNVLFGVCGEAIKNMLSLTQVTHLKELTMKYSFQGC